MIHHLEVRRGEYHDSVTLMLATRAVGAAPGVAAALVAMGTELNRELLAGMGFGGGRSAPPGRAGAADPEAGAATPDRTRDAASASDGSVAAPDPASIGVNDLIVAFSYPPGRPEAAEAALRALATALSASTDPGATPPGELLPPRTVASALRRSGGSLALISTPGPAAAVESMDALEGGASVIIFSDNMPLSHELRLKEEARRRDLLVMGPDCGTVVLAGVGYGFANVVRPGPVSLVAASGTGAQQVMCLLDAAGVGTRHCLGVGGRDLTAGIAGRSTLAALTALDADDATRLIVVVAKPPDPAVADRVRAHARTLTKPVVFALVGPDHPDLTAVTEEVLHELGHPVPAWPVWGLTPTRENQGPAKQVRGLFSGGTLCAEARSVLAGIPADLTDFGDDAYTRGRPHPMIDNTLRREAVAAALADPATGVLLLDVVLGRGAHSDPAAELAPALAAAQARGLPVVVSLCGTTADPQDLDRQARAFASAGAAVHLSNAAAARAAGAAVRLTSTAAAAPPALTADGSPSTPAAAGRPTARGAHS